MKTRSILHIRIDSFCAVVEQKRQPDLHGRALIVERVKSNANRELICASDEARRRGVTEQMSVRQAIRTCPEAAVIEYDEAACIQVYNRILDILAHYSPLLEPAALGSAYLDVTGSRCLFGDALTIAGLISTDIKNKLDMATSIGCASSKLLARAASASKRVGAVNVSPGFEEKFLSALPVNALESVSPKIARRLNELGVCNIGQLALIPEALLVRQFGPVGNTIRRHSLGIDQSQVRATYPPDIIIIEHVFPGVAGEPSEVWQYLRLAADEAIAKLRKRGGLAGEIMLEMTDESQLTHCAIHHFKKPTISISSVNQALEKLMLSKMQPGMEISQARITLSRLTPGASSQLCLLGDGERRQRLQRAVELIRDRFGDKSVCMAGTLW